MTDLPPPLVSLEVDLRDFPAMLLDVVRLRDSELVTHPDGEVFRCNVLSWCVSWHQVPAASLPDDEATLARLLGYGRDLRTFRKVRASGGLRGWVRCDDGRLYHPVVAEKATAAWQAKQVQRQRTEAARNARLQRQQQTPSQSLLQSETNSVTEPVTESKGSKVKVIEEKEEPNGSSKKKPPGDPLGHRLPPDWQPSVEAVAWAAGEGFPDTTSETAKFCDYWHAEAGQRARKTDWNLAWKVWMRKAFGGQRNHGNPRKQAQSGFVDLLHERGITG